MQLYTDAINDPGAIPNVETAWDTYVRQKCAEAKKGALKIYDQVMTKQMSSRMPCENDEILKSHEIAQRKSMEAFETETAELISTISGNELKELTVSRKQFQQTKRKQYLTIIPRARVGYEMVGASLALTITYPTRASGIIVL